MVKALNHQEPTESRRLWREVTEDRISFFLFDQPKMATSMSVMVNGVIDITVAESASKNL